jgi:Alcohol dehydrogenase GroES-like domain
LGGDLRPAPAAFLAHLLGLLDSRILIVHEQRAARSCGWKMLSALLQDFGQPLLIEDVPPPFPATERCLSKLKLAACAIRSCTWPVGLAPVRPADSLAADSRARSGQSRSRTWVRVPEELRGARVGVGWLYWSCGECVACREGHENICKARAITGVSVNSGCAHYVLARASHVTAVPEEISGARSCANFLLGRRYASGYPPDAGAGRGGEAALRQSTACTG